MDRFLVHYPLKKCPDYCQKGISHQWLTETIADLSTFKILQYNSAAQTTFQNLKAQRVRIGTQDLQIGAIALANGAVVLTRNLQDFERIPGFLIENWTF